MPNTVPAPPVPPGQEVSTLLTTAAPSHIAKHAQDSATSAGMITGHASVPSISIQGKQFKVGEDEPRQQGMPLDVIILATDPPEGVAKSYYAKAFSPDSSDAPDCASSNGKFPDPFIQSPVCKSCAECPNNVFGTSTDQTGQPGKGKACSDFKHLFVVQAHDVSGQIYGLRVPATSLKALSAYGRHLRDSAVPPQCVVTRLTFANQAHPQLEFSAVSWLSEELSDVAIERTKSTELRGLLPSKNSAQGPAAIAYAAQSSGDSLLPPPINVHVMTDKAGGTPYEKFTEQGWTDETLIEGGYMDPPMVVPTGPEQVPLPPPVLPEKVMTAKAGGGTYASFIEAGWNDETLIANGYMEIK